VWWLGVVAGYGGEWWWGMVVGNGGGEWWWGMVVGNGGGEWWGSGRLGVGGWAVMWAARTHQLHLLLELLRAIIVAGGHGVLEGAMEVDDATSLGRQIHVRMIDGLGVLTDLHGVYVEG
jgi:hypothetical protein